MNAAGSAILANRDSVLKYLRQEELLGSKRLVVLIVDKSLRVLQQLNEPLENVSADFPQKVVLAAEGARGSGVFFVETYPTDEVLSAFNCSTFYERVRHLLTETEMFVIDVLVVSPGHIRSGLGLRGPLEHDRPLRR